jgi:hypothetical protein
MPILVSLTNISNFVFISAPGGTLNSTHAMLCTFGHRVYLEGFSNGPIINENNCSHSILLTEMLPRSLSSGHVAREKHGTKYRPLARKRVRGVDRGGLMLYLSLIFYLSFPFLVP